MRVLSQSEIDNILSQMLANPGVLPDAIPGLEADISAEEGNS